MTIEKEIKDKAVTLKVSGRLDTMTAPQLEAEIKGLDDASSIVMDLSSLEYISSAGLRTILLAHKMMSQKDGLVVKNINSAIKEILDITGFSEILTIK